MDLEKKESWVSMLEAGIANRIEQHEKLRIELEEFRNANEEAHRQFATQAEAAAAKIAGGAQVINHVRELVRFFKDA